MLTNVHAQTEGMNTTYYEYNEFVCPSTPRVRRRKIWTACATMWEVAYIEICKRMIYDIDDTARAYRRYRTQVHTTGTVGYTS